MMFFRKKNGSRRWYKKKRWLIIMAVAGLGLYRNFAPDGAVLQDQLDTLRDLLPVLGG